MVTFEHSLLSFLHPRFLHTKGHPFPPYFITKTAAFPTIFHIFLFFPSFSLVVKKILLTLHMEKPLWNNGRYGRPFLRGFLFYNSVELFKAFFVYFDFDFPFRSFVRKFVTVVAYNFAFLLSFFRDSSCLSRSLDFFLLQKGLFSCLLVLMDASIYNMQHLFLLRYSSDRGICQALLLIEA